MSGQVPFREIARAQAERRELVLRALGAVPAPGPESEPARPRAKGFDGGARMTPVRRDPARDHGQLIVEMARMARTFGSAGGSL